MGGDIGDARAALLNLIDSAIEYWGSAVHVTMDTARSDSNSIAAGVKDQGSGIPKEGLSRILKRFYRVPGVSSGRAKGTGLGLYIVRSVAKRHKGRVWAESEGSGRGSTFVLQLPVCK